MEASTHAQINTRLLTAPTHDRPKLNLLLAHKQDLPKLVFPELSDDHNAFLNCLLTSEQAKHETVQYVAKFCSLDVNWPNSSEANKLREAFKQTYFTHMWQGSVEHAAQFLVNTGEEESTFAHDPFEIRKRLGIMMLQQPSSADKVSGKFTFRQSCLRCYYDFWVSTLKQAVAFMNTVQQYREEVSSSFRIEELRDSDQQNVNISSFMGDPSRAVILETDVLVQALSEEDAEAEDSRKTFCYYTSDGEKKPLLQKSFTLALVSAENRGKSLTSNSSLTLTLPNPAVPEIEGTVTGSRVLVESKYVFPMPALVIGQRVLLRNSQQTSKKTSKPAEVHVVTAYVLVSNPTFQYCYLRTDIVLHSSRYLSVLQPRSNSSPSEELTSRIPNFEDNSLIIGLDHGTPLLYPGDMFYVKEHDDVYGCVVLDIETDEAITTDENVTYIRLLLSEPGRTQDTVPKVVDNGAAIETANGPAEDQDEVKRPSVHKLDSFALKTGIDFFMANGAHKAIPPETIQEFNEFLKVEPYKGIDSIAAATGIGSQICNRTHVVFSPDYHNVNASLMFVFDVNDYVGIANIPNFEDVIIKKDIRAFQSEDNSSANGGNLSDALVSTSFTKQARLRLEKEEAEMKEKKKEINRAAKSSGTSAKRPKKNNEVVDHTDAKHVKVELYWLNGFAATDLVPSKQVYGVRYSAYLPEDCVIGPMPLFSPDNTIFLCTKMLLSLASTKKGNCEVLYSMLSTSAQRRETVAVSYVKGYVLERALFFDVLIKDNEDRESALSDSILTNVPAQCFRQSIGVGDRVVDLKTKNRVFGTVTYIMDGTSVIVLPDDGSTQRKHALTECWGVTLLPVFFLNAGLLKSMHVPSQATVQELIPPKKKKKRTPSKVAREVPATKKLNVKETTQAQNSVDAVKRKRENLPDVLEEEILSEDDDADSVVIEKDCVSEKTETENESFSATSTTDKTVSARGRHGKALDRNVSSAPEEAATKTTNFSTTLTSSRKAPSLEPSVSALPNIELQKLSTQIEQMLKPKSGKAGKIEELTSTQQISILKGLAAAWQIDTSVLQSAMFDTTELTGVSCTTSKSFPFPVKGFISWAHIQRVCNELSVISVKELARTPFSIEKIFPILFDKRSNGQRIWTDKTLAAFMADLLTSADTSIDDKERSVRERYQIQSLDSWDPLLGYLYDRWPVEVRMIFNLDRNERTFSTCLLYELSKVCYITPISLELLDPTTSSSSNARTRMRNIDHCYIAPHVRALRFLENLLISGKKKLLVLERYGLSKAPVEALQAVESYLSENLPAGVLRKHGAFFRSLVELDTNDHRFPAAFQGAPVMKIPDLFSAEPELAYILELYTKFTEADFSRTSTLLSEDRPCANLVFQILFCSENVFEDLMCLKQKMDEREANLWISEVLCQLPPSLKGYTVANLEKLFCKHKPAYLPLEEILALSSMYPYLPLGETEKEMLERFSRYPEKDIPSQEWCCSKNWMGTMITPEPDRLRRVRFFLMLCSTNETMVQICERLECAETDITSLLGILRTIMHEKRVSEFPGVFNWEVRKRRIEESASLLHRKGDFFITFHSPSRFNPHYGPPIITYFKR